MEAIKIIAIIIIYTMVTAYILSTFVGPPTPSLVLVFILGATTGFLAALLGFHIFFNSISE